MNNFLQIEDFLIETAGDLARSLSINPVIGQLYALLYIRSEPVSLDEMAEKLKISKGNVSVNIRILENWQAVKKVWIKGSRKDYYTAETNFLKIITLRLNEGINRRLNTMLNSVQEIKKLIDKNELNKKNKKEINFCKQRLQQIEEICAFLKQVLEVLPLLSSFKKKYLLKILNTTTKLLKNAPKIF